MLWNSGPLLCFANNGAQDVAIYNVYRMDSGNNSGGFTPTCHLYGGYQTFNHYETDYPPPNDPWDVWYINITGR
ncbi:MAG TPA: beta/gamma crystallin domain-containing protein [Ktedonobacteraceae bacterium]